MELVLTGKKIEFSPSCAEVVNDTSYIEDYNTFFAKVPDTTSSFFAKFANTTCFDQFCAEAAYKTA